VAAIGRPRADAPAAAASEGGVAEAAAVATLHQLNADWVRSFIDCDRAWYSDHLADDFVGTLGDGRRINKHDFLRHLTEQPRAETVGCDEVDVHLLDDTAVALVHGVIHVRGKDPDADAPHNDLAGEARTLASRRGTVHLPRKRAKRGERRRRKTTRTGAHQVTEAATLRDSLTAVLAVRRLVSRRRSSRAGLVRGVGSAATKRGPTPPLRGETSRIGDDLIPGSRPGAKNWTSRCVA
jgi:hypothetical protein